MFVEWLKFQFCSYNFIILVYKGTLLKIIVFPYFFIKLKFISLSCFKLKQHAIKKNCNYTPIRLYKIVRELTPRSYICIYYTLFKTFLDFARGLSAVTNTAAYTSVHLYIHIYTYRYMLHKIH